MQKVTFIEFFCVLAACGCSSVARDNRLAGSPPPRNPSSYQAFTLNCSPNRAGSLPNPALPPGQPVAAIPVTKIVVLMQENHSFDNYFGKLNANRFYGGAVDGLANEHFSLNKAGKVVHPHHVHDLCVEEDVELNNYVEYMTVAIGNGNNDGFAATMGMRSMGYFDEGDIAYYYALANQFSVADRYFSSMLGPTLPNRFFLWSGTAFGRTDNEMPKDNTEFTQKTIFDRLNEYGISWKYYTDYTGDFG